MNRKESSHKRTNQASTNKNIQLIQVLVIILLILVIFFVASQVSHIFRPIRVAIGIIAPPTLVAGLFYYIMDPFVHRLEERGLSRNKSILFVFLGFLLLISLGIALLVPTLRDQINQMITLAPVYFQSIQKFVMTIIDTTSLEEVFTWMEEFDVIQTLRERSQQIITITLGSLNSVIDVVVQTVLVILTAPIILYFLLKDRGRAANNVVSIFPQKFQKNLSQMLYEMNGKLSGYIRGQLLVALIVGIMFWLLFSIIGLDYSLALGFIAGILNLVPYLGSFVAALIALIIALFHSPAMVAKTLIAFGVEQLMEGRVVSPLILGSNLNIHPVTILFILLIAGSIGGLWGVVLGIPVYAILKVLVSHGFTWFREQSPHYDSGEEALQPINIETAPIEKSSEEVDHFYTKNS